MQNAAWLERMRQFGTVKTVPAETTLLSPGDPIHSIPVVLRGAIRVTRDDPDGKEILLYYIQPGESCVMSFLGEMHHVVSQVKAVTDEDSELLLIPASEGNRLLAKDPEWVDFFFTLFHKRFDDLLGVVNAIAFQKVDQRLEDLLRKKAAMQKEKELHVTHQQIADELGTAREVVSRLLKQMEKEGKIALGRNRIQILSLV